MTSLQDCSLAHGDRIEDENESDDDSKSVSPFSHPLGEGWDKGGVVGSWQEVLAGSDRFHKISLSPDPAKKQAIYY
jgi:hypothetical protein